MLGFLYDLAFYRNVQTLRGELSAPICPLDEKKILL